VDFILVLRGRCSGSRYTCCLINTLGLTELVSDVLRSRKQKEAETNAKIVDLKKHALDETKNCRNEQQRVEFHIALACVMHSRETQGTNNEWIARIMDGLHGALVVELWLHRVADDLSGLTFQEWDPSAGTDDTSAPVAMLVNSSELRAADFPLAEVRPLHLDAVDRGGRRTRGAAVRNLQGVGNSTFVLSVENDNDFGSRCE
jgi:hypothetical protein